MESVLKTDVGKHPLCHKILLLKWYERDSVRHWVMSNSLRPHDCSSLPGSSVHKILQARILEWLAISFSSRSSWPRFSPGLFPVWTTHVYVLIIRALSIYLKMHNRVVLPVIKLFQTKIHSGIWSVPSNYFVKLLIDIMEDRWFLDCIKHCCIIGGWNEIDKWVWWWGKQSLRYPSFASWAVYQFQWSFAL